jgi:formylglycine-generating enzyme required for sulfatase activity/tRNA A-37 threonylcarbamoyl transferase component Bud32
MPVCSLDDALEVLEELPLLKPEQLREITSSLQALFPDPEDLCAQLVERRWLTPFQVERVLQGRARDLVLGPYVLLDRLGEGGMSKVFKAQHQVLKRIVALKVSRKDVEDSAANERRLLREIQTTAELSHPNIIQALDATRLDDTLVFAMEYIEGADLAQVVRDNGPLPIARGCEYIRQAALGLQHAFERGLVHRDIKPSNLLLTADGSLVKIADMGLVRTGRASGESALTRTGAVIGTPDFLAPEQATDSKAVDIRADLYSLGCTLYFLFTGQPPFPDGTVLEKLFKHVEVAPQPVQTLRPEIPPEVAAVVHKLLAKRPEDRYQTPADLAEALSPFCPAPATTLAPASTVALAQPAIPVPVPKDKPPEAKALPPAPTSPPWRKWIVRVGAALVLMGSGLWLWQPWIAVRSKGLKPSVTNWLGIELVLIPSGQFTMGSPSSEAQRWEDEGPAHRVAITRPFYLAARETTVGSFRAFVEATQYKTEAEKDGKGALRWNPAQRAWEKDATCTWRNPGWRVDDEQPVVCLSRTDALAFCLWLKTVESKVYRLPTEAEWEYACRTTTVTAFSHGDSLSPAQANFDSSQPYGAGTGQSEPLRRTAHVGSYPANAWGLFDMHGNVWEWCADSYSPTYYRAGPQNDPQGPGLGIRGVARGGSWLSPGKDCRSARRLNVPISDRRNDLGFRVVLNAGIY